MAWDKRLNVLLIGGGMISQEVVIPTLLQERLRGVVGDLHVSALNSGIIKQCADLFPGQFSGYPDPAQYDAAENHPTLYREAMGKLGEHGVVVVATPDHLHTAMTLEAIEAGYDVIVMKPLCLKVNEAHQVIARADEKKRYVATDYHKRMDRAIRLARYRVRRGDLGEMLHGHAWIEEPQVHAAQGVRPVGREVQSVRVHRRALRGRLVLHHRSGPEARGGLGAEEVSAQHGQRCL